MTAVLPHPSPRIRQPLRPQVIPLSPAIAVAAGLLLLPPAAPSAERTVGQAGGGQFTSIQAAIDAAAPGDSIVVLDSATYVEDLTFGNPSTGAPDSKADVTLRAADGQRPTVKAANTQDRLGLGAPDYSGLLIWSRGVTVRGLDILNDGNAGMGALGLGTSLSVHASGVSVIDCLVSREGGAEIQDGAVLAVSDLHRLFGGSQTIEDILISDCTVEKGMSVGIVVYPFAWNLPGGPLDSIVHARIERCIIQDNAGTGFQSDALGSVELTQVTCLRNGGAGFEMSNQDASMTDCVAIDNGGAGVTAEIDDNYNYSDFKLTVDGLTCTGNRNGGLSITEGVANIRRALLYDNEDFNLRVDPTIDSFAAESIPVTVDHSTLYYTPGQADPWPNVRIDFGFDTATLDLTNSLIVGPIGIDNFDQAIPGQDLVVDHAMFWNGGAPVTHEGPFTATNSVPPADPLFADPGQGDFRLQTGSPAATADDQGGAIGAMGLVTASPTEVIITALGVDQGRFFVEWLGQEGPDYLIRAGSALNSDDWIVRATLPGQAGTMRWTQPDEPGASFFLRVEAEP